MLQSYLQEPSSLLNKYKCMYLLFLACVDLTDETKLSGQPRGLKASGEPPFCAKHKYVVQNQL